MRLALAPLLALALGSPGSLHAQDPSDADAEARALFEAGRDAFDRGLFASALEHFEAAHALSGRPTLLYNIGIAADEAGDDERAIVALERYLDEVEDAPRGAEVRERLDRLHLEREASAALVEDPPRSVLTRWWFWTLVGAGVAAVATGVLLGVRGGDGAVDAPDGVFATLRMP